MNSKALKLSVFLAAIVVLCVAGTKISRLTQTQRVGGDSLFLVVTGSQANGTMQTRAIEASNLLSSFTQIGLVGTTDTNLQLQSLAVFGAQTNHGGYVRFQDSGDETMYLFGGLFGPGLYGVSELSLGVPSKAIKLSGTGNGQLTYSDSPYGNIGNTTTYGISGVYATNGAFKSVEIRDLSTNALVYVGAGGILRTAALSGITFTHGILSSTNGGGGSLSDGSKGDVVVSTGGAIWTVTGHSGAMTGTGRYNNSVGAGLQSLDVFGQQTNYNGGYIRFDDSGSETMYLFGGLFGNGLYGTSELSLGVPNKAVKLTGTGNGQLAYSSAPYGNLGSSSVYGIDGVYATNGGFRSVEVRGLATNALIYTGAGGILRTSSVSGGLSFADGVLSISGGGGGGGLDFYQPGSAILTNISSSGWSIVASTTNVNGVSNYVGSISNLAQTKQLGSANLTNWSNIPTGAMANVTSTTFLTNWANAISNLVGSATGTGTNFSGQLITNFVRKVALDLGSTTNAVLSIDQTNSVVWSPSNNCALTLSGSWVSGYRQVIDLTIVLTNGQTSVVFPLSGPGGSSVGLLSAPSTNALSIVSDGTRQWIESGVSPINTNQFSADGSSIKSGASLTNVQLFATSGSGAIGNGLYQWGDGSISSASINDEIYWASAALPNRFGAYTTSSTGGSGNTAASTAINASFYGTRGGFANLTIWPTNTSQYATHYYNSSSSQPTVPWSTNEWRLQFESVIENAGHPLTNFNFRMGWATRWDNGTPTSGAFFLFYPDVSTNLMFVCGNNSTWTTNFTAGNSMMAFSNVIGNFAISQPTGATSLIFWTNGVPAWTNTTANTIATNVALIVGAKNGCSRVDAQGAIHSVSVGSVKLFEK